MTHLFEPPKLTLHAAAILSGTYIKGTTDEDWDSVVKFLEWQEKRDNQYTNQTENQ